MVKDEYWEDDEISEEAAVDYSIGKGIGNELFGPPTAGTRYECEIHGLILPRDVEEWGPDGQQPRCPYCGTPLKPE
jgi:hypothetical protein